MDDNRLYFNTISRQLIVERIKTIAGEPFVLEEFFAKDINYDPLRDFNSFKTSDQYGIREKSQAGASYTASSLDEIVTG